MSKNRPNLHAADEARTLPLPPPGYQPSKAELEDENDMPGLSEEFECWFRAMGRHVLGS